LGKPDNRAASASSTLGAFRVEAQSGKLTYLGNTPTEKQPRGFSIDPTGRFVVLSGEKSDTISSYSIDAESGGLKPIGRYPTGKGSNWVEIVAFE
jgi:6-phosphogluconolactonase